MTIKIQSYSLVFVPNNKMCISKGKGKAVPLQAWSGPEGSRKLRFPDFMTTAQDGGKVVSLTHRPPLPPGNTPGTHLCQRLSRPQGHSATGSIPMPSSGIEPATCRFVAQCLNHYATARTTKVCISKAVKTSQCAGDTKCEQYSHFG